MKKRKRQGLSREKYIDLIINDMNKEFGAGTAVIPGDEGDESQDPYSRVRTFISTRCDPIDWVLDLPGIPVGRLTEILGEEAGGKSTLALQILAETQQLGGVAILLDTEYGFNERWAKEAGVDIKSLILLQPDDVEGVLSLIERLVRTVRRLKKKKKVIITIVWDSVAGTAGREERTYSLEGGMGIHARLLSKGLRKLMPIVAKKRIALIFINQIREKIGVMFGKKYTTLGGRAIRFHASLRLMVTHKRNDERAKQVVGSQFEVKAIKNKLGRPFRRAPFYINYSKAGIDNARSLLLMAQQFGVVTKSHRGRVGVRISDKKTVQITVRKWARVLAKRPKIKEAIFAAANKIVAND